MLSVNGALTTLNAASLVMKFCIAGGLALTIVAAYGVWHHEVYQSGVNDTIAGIARADAKLVERATKARAKLKDCHATNREWDQSTGQCT